MRNTLKIFSIFSLVSVVACGGDSDHGHDHENEFITTVTLTFTPEGGGNPQIFKFDDPDHEGGQAPTVDDIDLAAGSYELTVAFANGLEEPPEDITEEIEDESDEHQLFFTGSAVNGPASNNAGAPLTHTYGDKDGDGNPVGLVNNVVAAAGTGELVVTLRHLPLVNDEPAKTSTLADEVRSGGISSILGRTDVHVTFSVEVK